jgi:putative nucleotidyltransferase with HDIG domain
MTSMSEDQISFKGKIQHKVNGWKHSAAVRFLLFLSLALFLYFSLSGQLVSLTYDIELGGISEKNIVAPKQIEDVEATEKLKDEAVEKVQSVYTIIPMKNAELIDNIFNKIEQVNADETVPFDDKVKIYQEFLPSEMKYYYNQLTKNYKTNNSYASAVLDEMNKHLSDQQYRIPEEVFFKFPRVTKEELEDMKTLTKSIVTRLMNDQILDAETPRAKVAELVNASQLQRSTPRELVQEIARFTLTPNKFYDEAATQEAKSLARSTVQTVFIQKGDIVVEAGQEITGDLYEHLYDLDLLKDKVNYWPQVGLSCLVGLFVFLLFMFMRQNQLAIGHNNVQLIMLILIIVLNVLVMQIIALAQNSNYPTIGYLVPVAMGAILITILIESSLAYIVSILFSVLAAIIYNLNPDTIFDYRYGFVAIVACFVSIFSMKRASQRSVILKAGIMISLFATLASGALMMIENEFNPTQTLFTLLFSFGGGLLTAVLVIGILPFFEVFFGILSPLKLVELSNPNHPLLRKLLTETPGTYHHSVMVANLSEAAAESIGADGLLCRVGSFYHDTGKTKRPSYFIENQVNIENPHNNIEPSLSKSIIVAHAKDGAEMLKEYKMPKQICDIAEQHHGTTLLKYFYVKAVKQAEAEGKESETIIEEDYRYPGPKAQSKEAAIVGVADCVEAAVRSLRNPTIEQIDTMVEKIIKGRLDDNQFNECDLTLKELDQISKTFKETLLGIFHSRIEYPEDLPTKSEKKGAQT